MCVAPHCASVPATLVVTSAPGVVGSQSGHMPAMLYPPLQAVASQPAVRNSAPVQSLAPSVAASIQLPHGFGAATGVQPGLTTMFPAPMPANSTIMTTAPVLPARTVNGNGYTNGGAIANQDTSAHVRISLPTKYTEMIYEEFKGPYIEILRFLVTQGLTQGLPIDAQGKLQVSAPFCSSYIECGVLSRWLAQTFLGKLPVRGVDVLGTDLVVDETYLWGLKEQWVAETFPGMKLTLRQADLAQDKLPKAGLTIGIHPEVTRGSPWDRIIANLLDSTHGGLVVLAHFFEQEAQAAVDMCAAVGVECQVFENSFYRGRVLPSSPWMRFIVIARPGRPGPPMPGHPGALPMRPSRQLTPPQC